MEIEEGLKVEIIKLTRCKNAPRYTKNPYIGMIGIVHNVNNKKFDLYTGSSWLVGIEINKCKVRYL